MPKDRLENMRAERSGCLVRGYRMGFGDRGDDDGDYGGGGDDDYVFQCIYRVLVET